MKKINLFIIAVALILTGCAGNEVREQVVTKAKTQLIVIPDSLLEECSVTPPPDKDLFVKTYNDDQRLNSIVLYSMDLIKDMAKCNNKITQIRELQNKQINIYKSPLENR